MICDLIKMLSKELLNFIFELGMLKRIKHEGWRIIGIDSPESISDHSLRAAQIGYMLSKLENYKSPERVCTMLVFHDIGECRIGDLHKVALRYVMNKKNSEENAVKDQLRKLGNIGSEILKLWKEVENKSTTAGVIAKDADLLEMAVTAKEYIEKGYNYAEDWINNVSRRLKTKSAKKLLVILKKSNSNDWWQGLKKIDFS